MIDAIDLRNKYRHIARIHMSDISTAKMLEKEHPSKTFDELLNITKSPACKFDFETATPFEACAVDVLLRVIPKFLYT